MIPTKSGKPRHNVASIYHYKDQIIKAVANASITELRLTSNNIAAVTMPYHRDYHILSPYCVTMVSLKSAPAVYVLELFFSPYIKSTHGKVKPQITENFSRSASLQNAQLSGSSTSLTTLLKRPFQLSVTLHAPAVQGSTAWNTAPGLPQKTFTSSKSHRPYHCASS